MLSNIENFAFGKRKQWEKKSAQKKKKCNKKEVTYFHQQEKET